LSVIPAGMTGLSFLYVFADVRLFWCSDAASCIPLGVRYGL